jgi:serine/threonine-protein kinase
MGARSNGSPARILGRYELHGELAAGGMATVHLGRLLGEAGFARTVAIKRLHPQFAKDPEFVAMFVDEARLAARIRHPNVVPTLDVISEDGEIFLVMEYVQGESLSRLLRALAAKKEKMPPHIATTLISGVLHGLHAAHEAKSEKGLPLEIVHRDVSPQNVLVGIDGIAHVLDFGVAKAIGRVQTTREGQLKGKLAYMAPEQLEAGTLTRKSDVYAAAVVLWETLTSKRLFDADNEGAILMKVMESKVLAPSTLAPGLPSGIDEVVLRGLARDPANRWATAREFALALEKCARVAPPSEIGEWMQAIAGEELARRLKKVADIEGGSIRLPVASEMSETAPESSADGVRVGEVPSQASSISVSKSEQSASPIVPLHASWARIVAGGLAGLLVVTVLFAFAGGGRGSRSAATSPPPSTSVAPTTPTATTSAIPTASPTAPATGTSDSSPSSSHADEPKPQTTGWAPADPTRPSTPAAPRPGRSRADCDPPFTRDAQGHKHYKLQCL